MSSRRNPKSAAPLRSADSKADIIATQDVDDNVMDMLTIMQEYQKKMAKKASSKSNAFQAKKNALVADVKKEAESLVRDGSTFFESIRASLDEMQARETRTDEIMEEIAGAWTAHKEEADSLLSVFPVIIEEVSHRRAEDINAASEMLETHPKARGLSRRRIMKTAKRNLEASLEAQKLATDASSFIKNYKDLLFW